MSQTLPTTPESAATEFVTEWNAWHATRERELADPQGWLSINRLEWLDSAPGRFDGLPGTWWTDGTTAHLRAGERENIADRDFELHPTGAGELLELDGIHIEIARRGDGYLIRIHDAEAASLQDFRGIPAYDPDTTWAIDGRFEPYPEPRSVTVGAVAEGLEHVYVSPGEIVVTHDDAEHRLVAFNGKAGGLNLLFTDATSGVTTYPANRSLSVATSDEVIRGGGAVTIDFNRATNLPCAFIDFATCPLPPAGNHLPFAVTAGEQTPYGRG